METTLSIKNCHRVKAVRLATEPGTASQEFCFRAISRNQSFMSCTYVHTATAPDGTITEIRNVKADMMKWVVTEWKYDVNLEDLWDAGVRAFSGTSHTPEDRAAMYIRDYEKEIQEDLAGLPENEYETYIAKYREWVITLFAKQSRVMSAMIVGPAKFPTQKNKAAGDAYERAYQDFRTWRENFFKAVKRRIEAAKPKEQRDDEEWQGVKAMILRTAETIFGIDTRNEPYYRSSFVTNLYGRLETIAKNGKVEIIKKSAELIKELNQQHKENGGKAIFTDRHKFWKLVEKAEEMIAHQEENANREDETFELDGCTVVKNYEENRLQIFHDEKPAQEVINNLKKEGWRWSRNNGCWQRQLTYNACYSAARVILGTDATFESRKEFVNKLWPDHQK